MELIKSITSDKPRRAKKKAMESKKFAFFVAQQNTPYASKPLYGAMRIRLTMEVRERFADRTTF